MTLMLYFEKPRPGKEWLNKCLKAKSGKEGIPGRRSGSEPTPVSGTSGLHLPVRTMLWRLRDSGFASSLLSLLCGSDGDTFAPTDLPGALGELQQSLKLSSWNWMSSQESSAQVLASDLPCRLSTPALGRNLLIPAPRTRG